MTRRTFYLNKEAQTFLEYTIIFGVVILILVTMTPMIKRGIQGTIKLVADQVGTQENAEQEFSSGGYLQTSDARSSTFSNSQDIQQSGIMIYRENERVQAQSNAQMLLDFTPQR